MRQGQAAFEFILTYGWVLLAILGIIGVISFFGVVDSKNVLPMQCFSQVPFTCTTFKADVNDGVQIKLMNNAGKNVIAGATVNMTRCGFMTIPTRAENNNPLNGGLLVFTGGACDPASLREGDVLISEFIVKYTLAGESVVHTSHGEIRALVEP